jgi:hypothetical protein
MACALVPASSYVWVLGNRLPAHACKLNNRGLADCAPTILPLEPGISPEGWDPLAEDTQARATAPSG